MKKESKKTIEEMKTKFLHLLYEAMDKNISISIRRKKGIELLEMYSKQLPQ